MVMKRNPNRYAALLLMLYIAVVLTLTPLQATPARAGRTLQNSLFDAWVEFKDKGQPGAAEKQRIIKQLEKSFNPRALKRRRLRRILPGIFDERDFPLPQAYLKGVAATGVEIRIKSRWQNGISVRASEKQLADITALPYVKAVLFPRELKPPAPADERVSGSFTFQDTYTPSDTGFYGLSKSGIKLLGLDKMHRAGFTGKGIIIAVLDTSFDISHRAFNQPGHPLSVFKQWDFIDNDGSATREAGDPADEHSHGTLVLGTLASFQPNRLMGTAYDADFILCRAEDAAEEYFLEEYLFTAALEFAEANGADVATASLVHYEAYTQSQLDGKTAIMTRGWNMAVENGIIGFTGSGNYGHDSDPETSRLLAPADSPLTITCGATRSDGTIAEFSSDGPSADGRLKPEVLTWGARVWTVSLTNRDEFQRASGVSISTPQMAGAVACLLQARPEWRLARIKRALYHSGDYFRQHSKPDPLSIHGYGIPDIYAAAAIKAGVVLPEKK